MNRSRLFIKLLGVIAIAALGFFGVVAPSDAGPYCPNSQWQICQAQPAAPVLCWRIGQSQCFRNTCMATCYGYSDCSPVASCP